MTGFVSACGVVAVVAACVGGCAVSLILVKVMGSGHVVSYCTVRGLVMAFYAACFSYCFYCTIDVACMGTCFCSLSVTVVAVGIIGMVNI